MAMLTTAGVICLSSGASEETPLACWITGSGTLALAPILPAATARPNATIPSSRLMLPSSSACFFSRGSLSDAAGPKAGLHRDFG